MFYTSYKSAPNFYKVFKPIIDEVVNEVNKMDQTQSVQANIFESEHSFTVEVLVPGHTKETVNLEIANHTLTIKGKEIEEKDRKVIGQEFKIVPFTKHLALPKNADINAVSAKFENGLLIIDIKKTPEAQAKTINIL